MQAARVWVSGRVQGVGFRAAARWQAQQLQLTGYARNLADGRVEILAQGEAPNIDAFAEWLNHGPPHARVESVQREPATVGELSSFQAD